MKSCIVITGGGTGGHVLPALAVSEVLEAEGRWHLAWIGSTTGVERQIVSRWGMEFHPIPAGKLRRYPSPRNLWDIFKTLAGFFRSLAILGRLRPVLLFSKGGYVSVPPVLAAAVLGIPVFSHESDVDPGLATRINSRFSRRVFVAYRESLAYYPRGKALCTGNPVRREILAGEPDRGREIAGFNPQDSRPILLVLGGSLGARQLNRLVAQDLQRLLPVFRIIHQTGKDADLPPARPGEYFPQAFFPETYPHILACADVVLSRCGAGSVWELAARSKPAVFVPLVEGSRGDQVLNARHCARAGAALVWNPANPDPGSPERGDLVEMLVGLAGNPRACQGMAEAWKTVFTGDAVAAIRAGLEEVLAKAGQR